MKKNKVIITLIIPVYNAEKHIQSLIESISEQKLNNRIEVIFVNDGSVDNSSEVIKKLIENVPTYYLFDKENGGAPSARNYGLKYANGEYIFFVDSDDQLSPKALANIVDVLENYKPELLIGGFIEKNEDGEILGETTNNNFEGKYTLDNKLRSKLALLSPLPGNKIYLKKVLDENSLFFTNVSIGQDLNFFLKYLACCSNVYISQNIYYYYLSRSGSISRTFTKNIIDIIRSIEDAESFYQNQKKKETFFFNSIKFSHYYLQYSKVPFIKNKQDRILVSNTLLAELKKINIREIDETFSNRFKIKVKLKLIFNKVLTSEMFFWLVNINN